MSHGCYVAVLLLLNQQWKLEFVCDVFSASRLMFEASGFLVSSVFLLIGVTLVLRVDVAVGRWFKRLIPDAAT